MKTLKNLILTALLITTFSAVANLKNSNITLGGGIVGPKETLSISLDKLVGNGEYNVQCQIIDSNNDKNKVMMVFDVASSLTGVTLNGKYASTPAQLKLSKNNTLLFSEVGTRNGALVFTNMDLDDSVEVKNCVAVPVER